VPAAEVEAARASAGAPVVAVPDESIGGPSVVETGLDADGDVVDATPGPAGQTGQGQAGQGQTGQSGLGDQRGQATSAATGEGSSPDASAAGSSGGLDTDAIRRAWPSVLGRIFTMRRLTWTFVSQNAQVMAFDGRTLTLGIATAGLTTTFRSGNHSEVVRQALIDELGVDAVVDGVHVDDIAQQPAFAPPAGAVPSESGSPAMADGGAAARSQAQPDRAPGDPASQGFGPASSPGSSTSSRGPGGSGGSRESGGAGGSWGDAGAGHDPRGVSRDSSGSGPSGSPLADAGLSPVSPRSLQDNAGWGSPAGPAPDWATSPAAPTAAPTDAPTAGAPASPASPTPAAAAGHAGSSASATAAGAEPHHARGASAVRESFAAARSASARREQAGGAGPGSSHGQQEAPAPLTDDSAVSDDDEDIEQSGDVGRVVIERVLGGRVVSETID
jgi:DNA polymerase-3 subunit gamma/tau